jgi:hypothetical protein
LRLAGCKTFERFLALMWG